MTPQHEEALRALRLADRHIAVLERIKDVPENSPSRWCFMPLLLACSIFSQLKLTS